MAKEGPRRRYPIGAEPLPGEAGTHFRVWAARRRSVEVVAGAESFPLEREASADEGYFSGTVARLGDGQRYSFRLDGEAKLFPDPASRFQPEGPHGPSQIVDPGRFRWTDRAWRGVPPERRVIYELHLGTFTPEGTFQAAARQLPALADLGITIVELMPIAEFPGRFGWGYDGVDLWAPTRLYGTPDDLRALIDAAHALGLGVILDVVYNHLGPDGNYLGAFSADYFTDRHPNEWGRAINFDGPNSGPVRELFVANAGYWIDEFHFDGLRLDATQAIIDDSPEHVLSAIGRRVREAAGAERISYIVAENESQQTRLVRARKAGGYGLDALWNDDFHHTAMVALTGHNEAYYTDYFGTPQELISAVRWGYLYQGQRYEWQKQRRGTPALDLPAATFVSFLENHDQTANSGCGARLHRTTSPGRLRAMTALLLLGPATPMLLQGQEFASSAPFLYFADHEPRLGALVAKGRREFLAQFASLAGADGKECLCNQVDPADPRTFTRCKLDFTERETNATTYALHRDLLRLRREVPAFAQQRADRLHGAVLGPDAFVLRFFCPDGDDADGDDADGDGRRGRSEDGQRGDRLLLLNLGRDLDLVRAPEPLLGPPPPGDVDRGGDGGRLRWVTAWSSEHPRYGGGGTPGIEGEGESDGHWHLPGESAVVMAPGALLAPVGRDG
jgi:maltooligosyltrehalose trehalohydrolase